MYCMRGADILVALLERQGVDTIFGIPGGAILPVYDALARSTRIRHILARHEQGAGFMAQGMARSTGKTAVFFATSGPGATNALTALADAKADSVPLVCVCGQVSSALLGSSAFQEVDICAMSAPVVKQCFQVRSALELLRIIPQAFSLAASGRQGPVLVDIPRDVQLEVAQFANWPQQGQAQVHPSMDTAQLDAALHALHTAQRPLVLSGGGVIAANATKPLQKLAENLGMPVSMSLLGLGSLPPEHPLYLGLLGMHGARCTNMALSECDLLLIAGARLNDRTTGKVRDFCPHAHVVHIDIDPGEHGKILPAHTAIVGDAHQALTYLLEHSARLSQPDRTPWLQRIKQLQQSYPLRTPHNSQVLSAYGIIRHVAQQVAEDSLIVTDVGQHQMRTAQYYPVCQARSWLSSGGLGTMGFGLPAAIGASLAWPERTVVCFTGDGGLLMNIQELATAAEQKVNIKIILANNNGLGLIQQMQELLFSGTSFAWNYKQLVNFTGIAKNFGLDTLDLAHSTNPVADLRQILRKPGPALIHVPLDARDNVYPVVPPGAANTQMVGG